MQCPVCGSWRYTAEGRTLEATQIEPAPALVPLALRAGLAKLVSTFPL